jgi:hypothetical protein
MCFLKKCWLTYNRLYKDIFAVLAYGELPLSLSSAGVIGEGHYSRLTEPDEITRVLFANA